ncbi:MAG: hypothetical protein R3C19_23335 [Planctomycetaceae bacterium]
MTAWKNSSIAFDVMTAADIDGLQLDAFAVDAYQAAGSKRQTMEGVDRSSIRPTGNQMMAGVFETD